MSISPDQGKRSLLMSLLEELPPEELACCAICNDGEWIEGVMSVLDCHVGSHCFL